MSHAYKQNLLFVNTQEVLQENVDRQSSDPKVVKMQDKLPNFVHLK